MVDPGTAPRVSFGPNLLRKLCRGAAGMRHQPATLVMVAHTAASVSAGASALITARAVGADGRGVLVILVTSVAVGVVIGTLGVNLAGRTILSTEEGRGSTGTFLLLGVLQGVLGALALALFLILVLPLFMPHLGKGLVLTASIQAAVTIVAVFGVDTLYAHGLPRLASLMELTGPTLQLIGLTLIYASGTASVFAYAAGLAAGSALQSFATMGVVAWKLDFRNLRSPSRAEAKTLLKLGLQANPASISQILSTRVDRYVIGGMLGPSAVGVYSVAATITELLFLPAQAYSRVIWKDVASGHADRSDLARLLGRSLAWLIPLAVLLVLVSPVLANLFGPEFGDVPDLVLLLAPGALAICVIKIGTTVLSALSDFSWVSRLSFVGLALLLVSDVVLIQLGGLIGAALANSLSAIVVSGLVWRKMKVTVGARNV